MVRIETVPTASLGARDLRSIRGVLDRAFDGEFSNADWQHAQGGHHVLVHRDDLLVAHAAVVARTLWIDGNEHDVGYVEAVATEPAAHGTGFGSLAMEAIWRVVERDHEFGVLSTGACHFYERLGWQRWRGPTSVRLASGELVRSPSDDGAVMIRSETRLDLDAPIACRERPGDDW